MKTRVLTLWLTDKLFSDSYIKRKHINHSYFFEIIRKPLEKRDESPIQSPSTELYHSIYIWPFGKGQLVIKKLFEQSITKKLFEQSVTKNFEQSVTKKLFEHSVTKKFFKQSVIKNLYAVGHKKNLSKWHSKSVDKFKYGFSAQCNPSKINSLH